MINTSNEYKDKILNDRTFLLKATVTLADSTVLELDDEDFMQGGITVDDAVSGMSVFQVGAAIINKNTITLSNFDGRFDLYDFTGAQVIPYVGLKLSESTEYLRKGTFIADDPKVRGSIVTIESLDNMSKFEKPFSDISISFPCTALQLLQAICTQCGVPLTTVSFTNSTYSIPARPSDEALNCLDVVSFITQISGNFARCNINGALELKWFDVTAFEQSDNLDGGAFDSSTPYATGDDADGGDFTFSETTHYDGGTFLDMQKYHHLYSFRSNPTIAIDDVVITGFKVTYAEGEETKSYLFGSDGYVISIENNPLITTTAQATAIANSVGVKIVGMRFRPMSVSAFSDPSIEAGDVAYVSDRKGNSYPTVLTGVNLSVGSGMTISCDAESANRNSATRYSEATKTIVEARNNTRQEISSYDIMMQYITDAIVNGMGLYTTITGDDYAGRIVYQHDKPTMEESVKRWFRTSEGYIQQTRPNTGSAWVTTSGVDIYGNALYNTLSVRGMYAEWIIAGILASANNSSWFNLDANSFSYANGALTYSPANGFRINTTNTTLINGILTAIGGNFSGTVTATAGAIAGWSINSTSLYRGSSSWGASGGQYFGVNGLSLGSTFRVTPAGVLTATGGNFSGDITSANATFNGNLNVQPSVSSEISTFRVRSSTQHMQITPTSLYVHNCPATADNATMLANRKVLFGMVGDIVRLQLRNSNSLYGLAELVTNPTNGAQLSLYGVSGNYVLLNPDGTAIATNGNLNVGGSGYFGGVVSAESFDDRTPFYDGDALAEIEKIRDDGTGEIDHGTLPEFARTKTTDGLDGRSIGNMVSVLTKGMQQLIERDKEKDKLILELRQEIAEMKMR